LWKELNFAKFNNFLVENFDRIFWISCQACSGSKTGLHLCQKFQKFSGKNPSNKAKIPFKKFFLKPLRCESLNIHSFFLHACDVVPMKLFTCDVERLRSFFFGFSFFFCFVVYFQISWLGSLLYNGISVFLGPRLRDLKV
jgi:hypothetical protein